MNTEIKPARFAVVETCIVCDEPTDRVGKSDDSLYMDDGTGPYCEDCHAQKLFVERLKKVK